MNSQDEAHTVQQALRRYFGDNPRACDTLAGIARWWLQGRYTPALVEQALESLHSAGLVERLAAADGRVRFRWNAAAPHTDREGAA
jgi:hypothetical protein